MEDIQVDFVLWDILNTAVTEFNIVLVRKDTTGEENVQFHVQRLRHFCLSRGLFCGLGQLIIFLDKGKNLYEREAAVHI